MMLLMWFVCRQQRFKAVDAEFTHLMRKVAHKPNIMEVSYQHLMTCRVFWDCQYLLMYAIV